MTPDDEVDLVRGLVAIPSLSRHESAATAWLVDRMRASGYDRAFVDEAGNAVGELGAADASTVIVLLGHIDTVPGAIPVRIAPAPGNGASVLYGRGSVDAKGPLATFVAAAARLGSSFAHASNLRIVVVGAVEEEAATSKGARHVAARFNGADEPIPHACIIGEPSSWRRVTLGYKGRLLMDFVAHQSMAHTAGPDAAVAEVVIGLWNWVSDYAARVNAGKDKAFEQLSPSLRRFITANVDGLTDTVDAQIAWRIPVGFETAAFVDEMLTWAAAHLEAEPVAPVRLLAGEGTGDVIRLNGARTSFELRFRAFEQAWRGERTDPLVGSFLAAIREADPSVQPGVVLKTGTSDMNVVAPLWQCPILAYGPGDSALDHTPNEHLRLDEYERAIGVLATALRTYAARIPSV